MFSLRFNTLPVTIFSELSPALNLHISFVHHVLEFDHLGVHRAYSFMQAVYISPGLLPLFAPSVARIFVTSASATQLENLFLASIDTILQLAREPTKAEIRFAQALELLLEVAARERLQRVDFLCRPASSVERCRRRWGPREWARMGMYIPAQRYQGFVGEALAAPLESESRVD